MRRKKRNFMKEGLSLLSLHFIGLLVNRATVLVFDLRSLEHLIAFSLLACVFVIAWLAVDLRLIEVGVEVARIRPVADIHDESAQIESMAYFGKARKSKSHDYHL